MDSLKKTISYRARLNQSPHVCDVKKHKKMRLVSSQVMDERTHRLVQHCEYRVCDNNEKLSQYKVNDFSVEVMQAIGAMDKQRPISLLHDVHTSQANIENQLLNNKELN